MTGKIEVVINTASKLHDKFFNIYTTQYDKRLEDLKKRANILNKPQSLTQVLLLIKMIYH